MFKSIGIFLAFVFGFFILFCALDASGLLWESVIGVKRENVRRNIYEQTRSFNEGKLQALVNYRNEYLKADEDGKKIIASTVRQEYAAFNDRDLNSDLKQFISECMVK